MEKLLDWVAYIAAGLCMFILYGYNSRFKDYDSKLKDQNDKIEKVAENVHTIEKAILKFQYDFATKFLSKEDLDRVCNKLDLISSKMDKEE